MKKIFLFVAVLFLTISVQVSQQPNPEVTLASVKATAGTDLCTAGGEAADFVLTSAETSFDGTDVEIIDCTFTINGAHSFNSITIGNSAGVSDSTLTHSASTTTTVYKMDLTVSGNTVINSDGAINLVAKGFERKYTTDGAGGTQLRTGVSTDIYGGGHGGEGGGIGTTIPAYDSITAPTEPGSGGDGGTAGVGHGGGYLKLITAGLTNNGAINANGQDGVNFTGGGAGGGLWIITSGTVSGSGTISADGGSYSGAYATSRGTGAGGRIAFYHSNSAPSSMTITAIAGDSTESSMWGGAGTIYIQNNAIVPGTYADGEGNLTIANDDTTVTTRQTPFSGNFEDLIVSGGAYAIHSGAANLNSLTIKNYGYLNGETYVVTGAVDLTNNAVLSHLPSTTTTVYRLDVTSNSFSIDGTSAVNLVSKGFEQEYTTDGLGGTQFRTGVSTDIYGGGHGGEGGGVGVTIPAYDSITAPTEPGAGGDSGSTDAGHGGGYLKLTTGNFTNAGAINADGGDGVNFGGGGAGGGIWITTTGTVSGAGSISVNGGDYSGANSSNRGTGAGGRIAFYHNNSAPSSMTFSAIAGNSAVSSMWGGAGTIYIQDNALVPGTYADGEAELIIANDDTTLTTRQTPVNQDFYNITTDDGALLAITSTVNVANDLIVRDYSEARFDTVTVGNNASVTNNANLTHNYTTTSTVYRLDLTVTNSLTIDATSTINVDGRGFTADYTSDGAGGVINDTTTCGDTWGGSHGGVGGQNCGPVGVSIDLLLAPADPGPGGGSNCSGSCAGGGYVKIQADDFTFDGSISADGNSPATAGGGGAGGGVYLIIDGTFSGAGSISANGAAGVTNNRGAGGGGRIAIKWDSSSATGFDDNADLSSSLTIEAFGNIGTGHATFFNSAGGTVYIEDTNTQTVNQGDLLIDNNNINADYRTNLFVSTPTDPTSYTFNNLSVLNQADLWVQNECIGGSAITVNGEIDLSGGGAFTIVDGVNCGVVASAMTVGNSLTAAVNGVAYSQSVTSNGGYAPKTYQCLDGLGGSVIACNAAAGLPTGLSMSSAGLVSGTPTVSGDFSFVVRVTDSDPGGAQTAEDTVIISVGNLPATPVLVSPTNAGESGSLTPLLKATYSDADAGDTGTIDFRISSSSLADCVSNTNIVESGTSAETATNNETASYQVIGALTEAQTYYWCARAYDGTFYDNSGTFAQMGSFLATAPAGSNQRFQAQQPSGDGGDSSDSSDSGSENTNETTTPVNETPTDPESEEPVEEDSSSEEIVQNPTEEIPIEVPVEEIIPIPTEEFDEAPGDNQQPQPQPRPTPNETRDLDRINQNISQPVTRQPAQRDVPPEEVGLVTRSQNDGRSFTIEVDDEVREDLLVVDGFASTDQDRIEFTGTTNLPNVTITLIFDNAIFVVVSSDSQGFWQAFVSAEELGLQPGEERDVTISAFAVKDDFKSQQVEVGTSRVFLTKVQEETELIAEFETRLNQTKFVATIDVLQSAAIKIVQENEPEIQATLAVTAPVVIASSAPLWGYLPYTPTLAYHFVTWVLGLLGRKKRKEGHLYGTVYDSITKEPIPLAIVRIYSNEENKLLATVVTDKAGRYESLLKPGSYKLQVVKPTYSFPSTVVTTETDGNYQNVSQGQIEINEQSLSLPDLPVDPANKPKQWSTANAIKKAWLTLQNAGNHVAVPVLLVGSVAGALMLINNPLAPVSWILTLLYVFNLILQLNFRTHPTKQWGIVYDLASGAAIPLATLQLIDPEFGKVVKSRLSDYQGRFAFLPEPGQYVIKANKEGYTQPEVVEQSGDLKPLQGKVEIKKEGDVIDGDVALKSE